MKIWHLCHQYTYIQITYIHTHIYMHYTPLLLHAEYLLAFSYTILPVLCCVALRVHLLFVSWTPPASMFNLFHCKSTSNVQSINRNSMNEVIHYLSFLFVHTSNKWTCVRFVSIDNSLCYKYKTTILMLKPDIANKYEKVSSARE